YFPSAFVITCEVPLSHAKCQCRYQDRHESKPEAKERLGKRNKWTDTVAKKAYAQPQKVWSQQAHNKKKLKKVNVRRQKDGLSVITLKQLTGRGGARAVAVPTPSPPSAPAIPTQRRWSRRFDISLHTDITMELADSARPGHLIVDMAFHEKKERK
ncbi:hypothetical protein LSAT2_032632, partial [Lamellibrachia satsuma]